MSQATQPVSAAEAPTKRRGRTPRDPQLNTPARSQRRGLLAALGVALIVVAALAGWWLISTSNDSVTVLGVSTQIPRGQEISNEDLVTFEVAASSANHFFTVAEAGDVVGQIASVDIPAATILTADHLGTPQMAAGESLVGLALTSAQLPASPLSAGDSVLVVATPGIGGAPASDTATYEATVFAVTTLENGTMVVDLEVDQATAVQIAALASTGNVALVIEPGA